jgi:hypothetical protein
MSGYRLYRHRPIEDVSVPVDSLRGIGAYV